MIALLLPLACGATEMEVFFSTNPPLVCSENGELGCIAGVLVRNAAKAAGLTLKAREISLAQAGDVLASHPDSLFLAMGRNEFSERSFNWFFRVYSDDVFIFTLDRRRLYEDEDIAKLGRIGVRRGSPFGEYLKKKGHAEKAHETVDWVEAVKLMNTRQIDGMCLTGLVGRTHLRAQGIPADRQNAYKVGELSWWLITSADNYLIPEMSDFIRYNENRRVSEGKMDKIGLDGFKRALEAEKEKPYFQEMLRQSGVRN